MSEHHLSRRRLLQGAGGLAAGATVGASMRVGPGAAHEAPHVASRTSTMAQGSSGSGTLLDAVVATCQRLAADGWRDLLLHVTNNVLDIAADDLRSMLAQPLTAIDRSVPGFEDFSLEGVRGIEPGSPARSLLYHALASPNVFMDRDGRVLSSFPTPAELEAVENYVYGAVPPRIDELRDRAGGYPLAIVVFALEYRSARDTSHRRHADICFSRTGLARLGTTDAVYDAQRREFLPVLPDAPFEFPVQPARYAAFISVQRPAATGSFGLMRGTEEDDERLFWVPLHKLFDGPECIEGFDLSLDLSTGHINEKLRRFHDRLNDAGFYTGWEKPETDQFPFVITGDTLAAFSGDPSHGSGWVMPQPHPLLEPAEYEGEPLSFFYSSELAANESTLYYSGLQIIEGMSFSPLGPGRTQALPENIPGPDPSEAAYLTGIGPDYGRAAPSYVNVRRRVTDAGTEENLNDLPDVLGPIQDGGYWARHYVDYSADGWVSARCPELDGEITTRVPAYSLIAPPSFYPYTNQRELTEWAESEVPAELRDGIWAIPPRPLSDRRLAANISLPAGFSVDDDTVSAIVSHPMDSVPAQTQEPATHVRRHLTLPDGIAGLFDPGWDVSQDRTADNEFFLASYGLGTPFVEDIKLCSSLSTYWPGVSPDSSREFHPGKPLPDGTVQGWPTIAPMTDEELGIVETATGGYLPWDGVRGPEVTTIDGETLVDYPEVLHIDYLETVDRFTAALTGAVDHEEYAARVLAMAQVYWALGIRFADYRAQYQLSDALDRFQAAKGEWAVLSFRTVTDPDEELALAEQDTAVRLDGERRYRFHLFRWGAEEPHPEDVRRILVRMEEQVIAYVDLATVLVGRDGDRWERHVPPRA